MIRGIDMEEFFERLNNFHKKYSRYFLMLLLIAAVVVVFQILPVFIMLFLPFIIGWAVSLLASPLTKFLNRKLHLPHKVGGVVTVLLLLGLLVLVSSLIISWVTEITGYVSNNWEEITKVATEYVQAAYDGVLKIMEKLPFELNDFIENENFEALFSFIDKSGNIDLGFLEDLSSVMRPLAGNVATGTIGIVKSLPEVIIFITILILATYFMTSNKSKFSEWYKNTVPERVKKNMHALRKECFGALWGTVKAQLFLTLITMIELFVGFIILGIDNAAVLALIISIVDMLPILGVGTVIIPWAIINFLAGGSGYITVGLISLYLICFAVRNLIQPKIVGESMGIGSLATLIAIWVGYKLFGFLGMLLMPALATILYKIYDIGLFDWFFLSHKKVTEERERLALENEEKEDIKEATKE